MKRLAVLCLAAAVLFAFLPLAPNAYCGAEGGEKGEVKKWGGHGKWGKGDWSEWKKGDWTEAECKDWAKKKRWHRFCKPRPVMLLGFVLGLALMIALVSGLLVLVRAVSPAYVGKLGKSINKHTLRNLIVGLVVAVIWIAIAAKFCGEGPEKNEALGVVLVVIAGLVGIGVVFAAAAMSEIVGGKVLALTGSKKVTPVRSIVAGLAVITLAACVICPVNHVGPGTLVLVAVLAIEIGAVLSVLIKRG